MLCADILYVTVHSGILFGESSLPKAMQELVEHDYHERNHQGLDHRLILEEKSDVGSFGAIPCRQQRGEMLNYYYR